MPTTRPEFENPPEIFYNASEAKKYTCSTRVRHIQRVMTLRALELLSLPPATSSCTLSSSASLSRRTVHGGALLLDVGCGSGISGEVLTEQGHAWVGVDISKDMLQMAKEDEEVVSLGKGCTKDDEQRSSDDEEEDANSSDPNQSQVSHPSGSAKRISFEEEESEESEDQHTNRTMEDGETVAAPSFVEVLHVDIGTGLPLRPGSVDGCVSISVLQWLCHSSKRGEVPQRRLRAFFQSLYNALRRGAKAVFQFYPSSPEQVDMIAKAAMKCGFNGGVVVDFPHSTKAKKHYLVIQAGQVAGLFVPPPALGEDGTNEAIADDEEDEEGSEEDAYHESDSDDEGEGYGRSRDRVRVSGRDRERVKRSRSALHHQQRKRRREDNRPVSGTKEWVLMKKAERRRRGEKTSGDTKYTMRQRRPRF